MWIKKPKSNNTRIREQLFTNRLRSNALQSEMSGRKEKHRKETEKLLSEVTDEDRAVVRFLVKAIKRMREDSEETNLLPMMSALSPVQGALFGSMMNDSAESIDKSKSR